MQVESLPAKPQSKGLKKAAKTMFSSVSSVLHSCPTLCNPMDRSTPWTEASLSVTSSQSLLKLMSIELVMACNHLILCHPLSHLQSFPASGSLQIRQFIISDGQRIGVSALASVLPMSIQD